MLPNTRLNFHSFGWRRIWSGNRPGDSREHFSLFVREPSGEAAARESQKGRRDRELMSMKINATVSHYYDEKSKL